MSVGFNGLTCSFLVVFCMLFITFQEKALSVASCPGLLAPGRSVFTVFYVFSKCLLLCFLNYISRFLAAFFPDSGRPQPSKSTVSLKGNIGFSRNQFWRVFGEFLESFLRAFCMILGAVLYVFKLRK